MEQHGQPNKPNEAQIDIFSAAFDDITILLHIHSQAPSCNSFVYFMEPCGGMAWPFLPLLLRIVRDAGMLSVEESVEQQANPRSSVTGLPACLQ